MGHGAYPPLTNSGAQTRLDPRRRPRLQGDHRSRRGPIALADRLALGVDSAPSHRPRLNLQAYFVPTPARNRRLASRRQAP
jgi:hypothetical protein